MNTSDERGELLRPLREIDGADGPPPRYDVALAMRQGDAIRRRRRSIGALAAIVVVGAAIGIPLGLPSPQHAEPTPAPSPSRSASPSPLPRSTEPADLPVANCTLRTLTTPAAAGAFSSWINPAIDPTGRYVVTTLIKTFTLPFPDTVIPSKALLVDLRTGATTLFPGSDTGATAVNASGVVVGSSGSDSAGWVYRDGKVSLLPRFHGAAATPLDINARGDILGMVVNTHTETSVIWPAANPGTVRALKPANFLANTITDAGLIGGAIGPFDEGKPYVGDGNGNGHTLSTGLADTQGNVSQIRGHYAIGEGPIFAGRFPTLWNLTTGTLMTYPNMSLNSVATDGTIVGTATDNSDGYTSIPLIDRDGQIERLPTGHGDSPQVNVIPVGITDDGHTILGTDRTPANTEGPYSKVALLWHC